MKLTGPTREQVGTAATRLALLIAGLLLAMSGFVVTASAASAPVGPYGPDTCVQGYVWRETIPDDHVCVHPDTRTQAGRTTARLRPGAVLLVARMGRIPVCRVTCGGKRHPVTTFVSPLISAPRPSRTTTGLPTDGRPLLARAMASSSTHGNIPMGRIASIARTRVILLFW